jgi:hypothetical protein
MLGFMTTPVLTNTYYHAFIHPLRVRQPQKADSTTLEFTSRVYPAQCCIMPTSNSPYKPQVETRNKQEG